MALLDLMFNSLFNIDTASDRKMFFKVHVLYIDEGQAVYGWTPEEHKANIDIVTGQC